MPFHCSCTWVPTHLLVARIVGGGWAGLAAGSRRTPHPLLLVSRRRASRTGGGAAACSSCFGHLGRAS